MIHLSAKGLIGAVCMTAGLALSTSANAAYFVKWGDFNDHFSCGAFTANGARARAGDQWVEFVTVEPHFIHINCAASATAPPDYSKVRYTIRYYNPGITPAMVTVGVKTFNILNMGSSFHTTFNQTITMSGFGLPANAKVDIIVDKFNIAQNQWVREGEKWALWTDSP